MVLYPGGTPLENSTVGYSLFENYLSDLGRTVSWSGERNAAAATLFNTAVVLLGLAIIPFFAFLPTHAPDKSPILWVAALFGIGSSLALIGIGFTPYDIHLQAHQTALFFWVICLFAAAILHFWAMATSKECSDLFALLSLGLAGVIGAYICQGMDLFAARFFGSVSTSVAKAITMQKWVVLAAMLWYLVFGVRMVCTTELTLTETDDEISRTAERYVKRLQ
jgi:hypothetical membrane protein